MLQSSTCQQHKRRYWRGLEVHPHLPDLLCPWCAITSPGAGPLLGYLRLDTTWVFVLPVVCFLSTPVPFAELPAQQQQQLGPIAWIEPTLNRYNIRRLKIGRVNKTAIEHMNSLRVFNLNSSGCWIWRERVRLTCAREHTCAQVGNTNYKWYIFDRCIITSITVGDRELHHKVHGSSSSAGRRSRVLPHVNHTSP